jgi:hypothetical protein
MADLNDRIKEQKAQERELAEIDEDIAGLRNAYEQYFLGLERKPPVLQHDRLRKRLLKLKTGNLRGTVLKFRVGTVEQKFKTYERMWERTLKEIENGTYRRDLAKLKRRTAMAAAASAKTETSAQDTAQAAAGSSPGAAQAASGAADGRATLVPPSAPGRVQTTVPIRAGAAPSAPSNLSDAKVKAIYDAYVTAKRRCQEDVSKLSLDTVASSLRRQVPELLKKHNAKDVDFKVVIKDGKAVLRAVPK